MTKQNPVEFNKFRRLIALTIYVCFAWLKGVLIGSFDGIGFWLFDFFAFVVVPTILFVFLKNGWPLSLKPPLWSFNPPFKPFQNFPRIITLSVLTFFLIVIVHGASIRLGISIQMNFPDIFPVLYSYTGKLTQAGNARTILVIYLALTAGIVEEYFFRGISKNVIEDYWTKSKVVYVFTSSLLFASVHWAGGLANTVNTFFIGILCAIVYLRIKTLVPLIIAHAFFDWTVL